MSIVPSLRESFAQSMKKRLVAFFAILIVAVGITLTFFLWHQRRSQVRNFLATETNRIHSEIIQIRENAERVAQSIPEALFASPDGPYEHVDEFTRILELNDVDLGWIISVKNGVAQPWIDGRRRVVLSGSTNDFVSEIAADLTNRPWPQANEGSGRSYSFAQTTPEPHVTFVEVFPVYVGPSQAGFIVVAKVLSFDSAMGEVARRQFSANSAMIDAIDVIFEDRQLFRAGKSAPGFFNEVIEFSSTQTTQSRVPLSLKAHARFSDLWLTLFVLLCVGLVGFSTGLVLIGRWTRRTVQELLEPLRALVNGTALLASGDFSVRVREPKEEELRTLAEKFNFLASSLEQTMQHLASAARREEEAKRYAIEAEIIQLRAQLQPHFLFNSLNMVAQTILDNPNRAYEMTLEMADLFRAILHASSKVAHPIEDELNLVGSYLRIQSMRFAERLSFSLPQEPLPFSLQVPCLALQNLVENAVKHGITPQRSGGHISISLELLQSQRRIIVENNGTPIPDELREGTGLQNTRRRWRLLHGETASLELEVNKEGKIRSILSLLVSLFFAFICANHQESLFAEPLTSPAKPRVCVLLPTSRENRWQQDRKVFLEAAQARNNLEIVVHVARNRSDVQAAQLDKLIADRCNYHIIAAHDYREMCRHLSRYQSIQVIAYDRPLPCTPVKLYIGYDNYQIGKHQGEYLARKVPVGSYLLLKGPSSDGNSHAYFDGAKSILAPLVALGKIRIAEEKEVRDWSPARAQAIVLNAWRKQKGDIQAILAPNDAIAEGVVETLKSLGVSGKVVVTGQDGEAAALERIKTGSQAMTVEKNITRLVSRTLDVVTDLASGKSAGANTFFEFEGQKLPSVLLEPELITAENLNLRH
jgi:D-xylose transport system substrate-binding protein